MLLCGCPTSDEDRTGARRTTFSAMLLRSSLVDGVVGQAGMSSFKLRVGACRASHCLGTPRWTAVPARTEECAMGSRDARRDTRAATSAISSDRAGARFITSKIFVRDARSARQTDELSGLWTAACFFLSVRRRLLVTFGTCLAFAVLLAPRAARSAETLPSCVRVWAEARYRPFGYDHLVYIHNDCARTAACTVSTDVNPDRMHVSVRPQDEVEVVTWVGSPARVFKATVACDLR